MGSVLTQKMGNDPPTLKLFPQDFINNAPLA